MWRWHGGKTNNGMSFEIIAMNRNRTEANFKLERATHETPCFIKQTWQGKTMLSNQFAMQAMRWTNTCAHIHKHMLTLKTHAKWIKRAPGNVLHHIQTHSSLTVHSQEQFS